MPKTRQQKETAVNAFNEKLAKLGAGVLLFINYRGMNVAELSALRRVVKKAGGEVTVLKKTLARVAFKGAGIPTDPTELEGEVAFVSGYADAPGTAKAVYQAFRKNERPVMLGGWLEGRLLAAEEMIMFATLPGREQLLGQLVGTIAGPMRGMVGVLSETMAGLVRALHGAAQIKN